MTGGRAIFGSGPGALPSDAYALGIDPDDPARPPGRGDRHHPRLFRGERVTQKGAWYDLHDAGLQLLPLQEEMPFAVASQISPSGMTLAGKYGIGIISLGSMSDEGLTGAADPVGLCRERREEARHDGRPQELARAAQLAHRRDPREGA
jgi:limonene 1,2-monooxygenase